MAASVALTRQLVIDALTAQQLKYTIDDEGDLHVVFSRRKGKDIDFFVFNPERTKGFLVAVGMCSRYFENDQLAKLITFCNTWNRDKRMPRAYVAGPDSDGDFTVRLDLQILCERGVPVDLVQDNLDLFMSASISFWNALDEEV